MHVLLIDSESPRAWALGDHLVTYGHTVDYALTGQGSVVLATQTVFDAVVIRRVAQVIKPVEVIKRLRANGVDTLAIVLDERGSINDIVAAFAAGADDYRARPVDPLELDARLRSMAQRGRLRLPTDEVTAGRLRLDMRSLAFFREGRRISVTTMQAKVLYQLLASSPRPVSPEVLERAVWPDNEPGPTLLRSHVASLRRRIDGPFAEPAIRTHLKVGYSIALE